MGNIRVLIIDSGRRLSHKIVEEYEIVKKNETYVAVTNHCIDKIGHGSAVIGIITEKELEQVDIICVKIYDKTLEIDEEKLLFALSYIYNNIPCDVLHISSGIIQPDDYAQLYSLCYKIKQRGTIIVSAFDNDGAISYPAAFPFVIGVDTSENRTLGKQEYEYVEGSIVNIRVPNYSMRVQWTIPSTLIAWGNSYSSVNITCMVIKCIQQGIRGFFEIL